MGSMFHSAQVELKHQDGVMLRSQAKICRYQWDIDLETTGKVAYRTLRRTLKVPEARARAPARWCWIERVDMSWEKASTL